ncbi:MAG: hypothetical protein J4G18_15395 [Anaerolineae bacterium]|nr:hypothetical protein [Anaerolineae bacterium]
MASTTKAGQLMRQAAGARAASESPAPDLRLDWIMSLSSCAIVFGLYIDGWAHNHGRVDDSFFTPWHALLYGSVAFAGLALILTHFRNVNRGYRWAKALPAGYALSLIGFFGFGAGGVVDLIWHEAFGFEEGVEALISPSHLYLAVTGLLIMTGPIRSFWKRESDGSWASVAPIVLCFTAVTSVFTFFNAYAPIGGDLIVLTGTRPDPHTLQDVAGIVPFIIQSNVLLGALLFMTRRWQLPFGAITLFLVLNSLLMTWYRVGESAEFIYTLSAFAVGLLCDSLYQRYGLEDTKRLRFFAFIMPFSYSLGVMLMTHILGTSVWGSGGLWWLIHMWLGVPVLAGAFGYGLSLLMRPPAHTD